MPSNFRDNAVHICSKFKNRCVRKKICRSFSKSPDCWQCCGQTDKRTYIIFTLRSTSDNQTIHLYELRDVTFKNLVKEADTGLTIVVLVDEDSKEQLLNKFAELMQPYSRWAFFFKICLPNADQKAQLAWLTHQSLNIFFCYTLLSLLALLIFHFVQKRSLWWAGHQ